MKHIFGILAGLVALGLVFALGAGHIPLPPLEEVVGIDDVAHAQANRQERRQELPWLRQ
jgi:hypothetical protein